ncbi:CD97 antigen, partial [Biomphalaria glabrata]
FISIVLNGLQGVAIFVSFICNKRVFLLYKQMISSNRKTTTEELGVESIQSKSRIDTVQLRVESIQSN